jgi:hypothetical protein
MGFSFRKRIKILPGAHINLSKSGVSTSIGTRRRLTLNLGKRGMRSAASIHGIGIRYIENVSSWQRERRQWHPDIHQLAPRFARNRMNPDIFGTAIRAC